MYIYHHLGLGDHISCHGIVRHYCENESEIKLFVKEHNLQNVKRMYKDIKNLEYIVGDDNFVKDFLRRNQVGKLLKIGFEQLNSTENFEYQFYKLAGLPIEYKYSKFYIDRDFEKEKSVFETLNLEDNNYLFVHSGGYKLKDNFFENNIRIVEPIGYGFFDWMYTIENSKQIHCIDSSFICLIDCMETKNIPLFNHRYVRNYPNHIKLYDKKNWVLIQ